MGNFNLINKNCNNLKNKRRCNYYNCCLTCSDYGLIGSRGPQELQGPVGPIGATGPSIYFII
ncbi:MAG: hypothetical protein PHI76_02935 [Clostridia bacterium]|nr:hypothetical protein [Clostridia bacterium]